MKKILVSVLAIAGLVACNNENVVSELDSRTPITFDGVFVENATRADDPSTTTDNINEFYVWAYMNEVDGTVFEDEKVSRSGAKWTYDHISYWMPDNHYFFAAFAGDRTYVDGLTAMDAEGLGEITFTNNDGTNDILYAEYDVVANATNAPVKFQFAHLLSKVKFTFINGFANENQTVVVKNIQMVAPETASVNLSEVVLDPDHRENNKIVWDKQAGNVTLDFGDMNGAAKLAIGDRKSSDNERLTIPASAKQSYTITFLVDVYNGNQAGIEDRLMTVELKGFEFVAGRAYNLVATINQENLNLDAIEFEVVVDEWIDQEVDGGAVEGEVTFVSTIKDLQDILNAAAGDTYVVLGADLTGNVTVPELAGATIAINGNGHTFDGTFALVGGSTYGKGTTIFEGINFKSSGLNGYDAFIYCNEQNGNTRYPDNVTIKRCTFEGTDAIVAAKFRSLNGNLVVEDCKAKNMHSLLQLLSCGEATVLVDGVEAEDCGRGLSLQNSTNVIRNSNIVASSYGVRLEGGAATTTIENSTIEAKQPVIVRNVTVAGYVLNLDATSVLNTAEAFQVIFTKNSDDKPYVAPEVAFTFNGPATTAVFPGIATDAVVANNTDELNAAIAAKAANIVLVGGETYTGAFKLNYAANITAKGGKAIIAGRFDVDSNAAGSTFTNLKFEITADSKVKKVFTGANYAYPSTVNIYAAGASFENCEFVADIATGVCGINYGAHTAGEVLKVNNCSFVGDFYAIRTRTLFEITNCTFDIYTTQGTLAAVWTWGNGNSGADKVTFVGNKNVNANKVYGVQMTSTTFAYDKLVVNVQKNDNFHALANSINSACNFAGTTFVSGSEKFEF